MSRFISLKAGIALITAFVLSLGVGVTTQVAQAATLPDKVNLTVHYYRGDADYTNWTIYTWKNYDDSRKDVDNGRLSVTGNDSFGGVYQSTITGLTGFDSLGFLVTYKTSWTKDVGADRFFTSVDANGNIEVWLRSGDPTIYTTEQASPDLTPSIISADLISFNTIHAVVRPAATLTSSETEDFRVRAGSDYVTGVSVTPTNASNGKATEFDIVLPSDADLSKSYRITKTDYSGFDVSTRSIYDSPTFIEQYTYTGDDLGNTYSAANTKFRVWAPTAQSVSIMKHANADESQAAGIEIPMTASVNGTWTALVDGDQDGMIYDYKVNVNGSTNYASDPYARSSTIDSGHSVVVNLKNSNPVGWAGTKSPEFGAGNTDAIIYELQVRDLSSHPSSGVPAAHVNKFAALADANTSYKLVRKKRIVVNGKVRKTQTVKTKTGLSAIKELGVTHVQLLPVYDFNNIGEGGSESDPPFNWGYDPVNYNVPDGGFSSNPSDPYARIRELKRGIQAMHRNGLRTIMDVVYNHVSNASTFSQEQIVPGYFFRYSSDGSLTSASGCGNDVNSERPMVRKFIVDSVTYWAKEYHFDGFRFDLMGLLDVTTINQIRAALDEIDPKIVVIGEGWNMGDAVNPANQGAAALLPNIGFFNDQIRDATKGSVFNSIDKGFVQGGSNGNSAGGVPNIEGVKAGITAQTEFDSLTSTNWQATTPGQSVNYVEAHDNLTLWDKLNASFGGPKNSASMLAAARQSAAIVFTSQGIAFMQAGQEFLRTKGGNDNSYNASDAVNGLNWASRAHNMSTVKYYQGLIKLRKTHPAFRMTTSAAISDNLKFLNTPANTIGFAIDGAAAGDSWSKIVVIHNANAKAATVSLPSKGDWSVTVNGKLAGVDTIKTLKGASKILVEANSSVVVHN